MRATTAFLLGLLVVTFAAPVASADPIPDVCIRDGRIIIGDCYYGPTAYGDPVPDVCIRDGRIIIGDCYY